MPYMVTFTINIPQMLAYIPYMDPIGHDISRCLVHIPVIRGPTMQALHRALRGLAAPRPFPGSTGTCRLA